MAFFSKKKLIEPEGNQLKESLEQTQNELIAACHESSRKDTIIENLRKEKNTEIENLRKENEKLKITLKNLDELRGKVTSELFDYKKENEKLRNALKEAVGADVYKQEEYLQKLKESCDKEMAEVTRLKNEKENLKREILGLNLVVDYTETGLYAPSTDFTDRLFLAAEDLTDELSYIKQELKWLFEDNEAFDCYECSWYEDWSYKGKKIPKDQANIMKLSAKAFNNECAVIFNSLKLTNLEASRAKIRKAAEQINKLNSEYKFTLSQEYIDLKIQELEIHYSYLRDKDPYKEAERQANEEADYYYNKRSELKEELSNYKFRREELLKNLNKASSTELTKIQEEISKIDENLNQLEAHLKEIKENDFGYLYIVSNIGSFGEGVYKIGICRKKEYLKSIERLNNQSVPFPFDLQALIFSKNVEVLKMDIYKNFEDRRVNMLNIRKDFFRVPLEEIIDFAQKNEEEVIKFVEEPPAIEFRETPTARKQRKDKEQNNKK